ncbi:MAG: hypothetical protein AAGE01_17665 [Pseudomonadota bacterium]
MIRMTSWAAVLLALATGSVQAQDSGEEPESRFLLRLGAYLTDGSGSYGVTTNDGNSGNDDLLDFDQLGVGDEDDTFMIGLTWKKSKRLRFDFIYYDTNYGGTFRAERSFFWEGQEIPVGAQVASGIEAEFLIAQAGYSMLRGEKTEAGLGLGMHVVNFGMFVNAQIDIDGQDVFTYERDRDFLAPLPNLYGYLDHQFTDRLSLRGYAGYFSLSYDDYDGELTTANLTLDYRLGEQIGIGAGYSLLNVDVERENSRTTEVYDVDFNGPQVFLTYQF